MLQFADFKHHIQYNGTFLTTVVGMGGFDDGILKDVESGGVVRRSMNKE